MCVCVCVCVCVCMHAAFKVCGCCVFLVNAFGGVSDQHRLSAEHTKEHKRVFPFVIRGCLGLKWRV